MIRRLLEILTWKIWHEWKLLPVRYIDMHPEKGPLLIRYYLFVCQRFSIYIHFLVRSDDVRALHDHPWNFWTLILAGCYWEETPADPACWYSGWRLVRAGNFLYRPATWIHRLRMSAPCWTLVFHTRTKRSWGFIEDSGETDFLGHPYTHWTLHSMWRKGSPSLLVHGKFLTARLKGTD